MALRNITCINLKTTLCGNLKHLLIAESISDFYAHLFHINFIYIVISSYIISYH